MVEASVRPFRFGVGAPRVLRDRADLVEHVRFAEDAGYAVGYFTEHHFMPLAPLIAMAVAAESTERLRLGTLVLANDLRHPAVLAKDLATLDLLSGGRVEAGLGAGWLSDDFDRAGVEFRSAGTRVARLAEAVEVLRGAWRGEPFTFDGEHYRIRDLVGHPQPVQRPGPPMTIGGGMRKVLTLAARVADTVTVAPQAIGTSATGAATPGQLLAERIGWVAEAAAAAGRAVPECHILLSGVAVSNDRRAAARALAAEHVALMGDLGTPVPAGFDEDALLSSPFWAIGTVDGIVEQLLRLRDELGISYLSVMAPSGRAFVPVVEALTGR